METERIVKARQMFEMVGTTEDELWVDSLADYNDNTYDNYDSYHIHNAKTISLFDLGLSVYSKIYELTHKRKIDVSRLQSINPLIPIRVKQ